MRAAPGSPCLHRAKRAPSERGVLTTRLEGFALAGLAKERPRSARILSTGGGRDARVAAAPAAAPASEPLRGGPRFSHRWDHEPPAAGLLLSSPHPPNAMPGGITQYRECRARGCPTAGFSTLAAPVRWRRGSSQPSPAPFGSSSIWEQPILPLCGRRAPSPGGAVLSFPLFLADRMPRCIEQLEILP